MPGRPHSHSILVNELLPHIGVDPAVAPKSVSLHRGPGFASYALVFLFYLLVHLFVFRGVVVALPDLMAGQSVLNTSELVPFFSPNSQFFEQVGGGFSDLTNGYEFRVRYSILTTWMRYYLILPFAIILTPFLGAYVVFLVVTGFLRKLLPSVSPRRILRATALTTLLIHLLILPAKITHFYTLIIGFDLFVVALFLLLRGLFLEEKHPRSVLFAASLVALINPAVYFLILYPISLVFICLCAMALLLISRKKLNERPDHQASGPSSGLRLWRRIAAAIILMLFFTIIPYGLFIKFYVLHDIRNFYDIVPDILFSIRTNSVSLLRQITFDLGSATDNYLRGGYLSPTPRFGKLFYFLLALIPFFLPVIVTAQEKRRLQPLLIIIGALMIFSMWCSIGYADVLLFPTFHTILAAIFNRLYLSSSQFASIGMRLISEVIHVLRYPDRFQFIFLATMAIMMPLGILTMEQCCTRMWPFRFRTGRTMGNIFFIAIFFLPLLAHWEYRSALLSGDFGGFLRPYNVQNLREIKDVLHTLPQGKTVIFPSSESQWIGFSNAGEEYKFIDKFFIYFLDAPSYYIGLTGELENKSAFYLLYQALSQNDFGWVDIARNLHIRYLIINKELIPPVQSPWYLKGITRAITEQPKVMTQYFRKLKENSGFALYELIDPQPTSAPPLLVDTDWKSYKCLQEKNRSLTSSYRTIALSAVMSPDAPLPLVLAEDSEKVRLDLYAKSHAERFFRPDQSSFAFNADHLPSSYYFGTIFPMFNLLTASSYNVFRVIMPGTFDTLTSTFVGLLKPTTIRFPISVAESRTYEILLRGVATEHTIATRIDDGPSISSEIKRGDVPTRYITTESAAFGVQAPFAFSPNQPESLTTLIPKKAMPVSDHFSFVRLGLFDIQQGSHWLYLQKQDSNPLIVEGILLFPLQKQNTQPPLPAGTRFITPERLSHS